MAAIRVPPPGTRCGPCTTECQHRDCAQARRDAAATCALCVEPIGYDTRYYEDKGEHVHAVCLESAIERGEAP